MATSTSAKKVAKLASKGKGKKVRFQGGTVFPLVVVIIVVLGLLTIVYSRQSRPSDGSGPPRLGDHWHAAFGLYVCDGFQPKLVGTKEEQSLDPVTGQQQFTNKNFRQTGVHSHGDGVIHYHPYSSRATGTRARMGVFFDVYDIKVSNSKVELPADQGGDVFDTKNDALFAGTTCAGKEAEVKMRVWTSYASPNDFQDYITDLTNVRIGSNGMVFVLAVVPKGADIAMPPWAAELPELGAVDGGDVIEVPTTGPEGSSVPTGDTAPTDTAPTDTAPTDTGPAGSGPADTAVTTTTTG